MVNDANSGGVKVVLDWKDNPTQNGLAYVFREGIPVAVNPAEQTTVAEYVKANRENLQKLRRRGYKMEGATRSPWYDSRCLRKGATPRSIAQELDRDPRGTVGKVFDVDVLDRMMKEAVKPPVWQGKPGYDSETMQITGLIQQENGPLKLWFRPGIDHDAPHGPYVLACDVSTGGVSELASNSATCGVNLTTGEQVLEYAVHGMMATKFARLNVALARWLHGAYLGWEAGGPARVFAEEVYAKIGYYNVFFREVEDIGIKTKTRKMGWLNNKEESKWKLFEDLCLAFKDGGFIPRSADLIRECGEYEGDQGRIVHKPSKQAHVFGQAHGDRVIATGVAWLLCQDRQRKSLDNPDENVQDTPQYGSWLWRERMDHRSGRRWTDDDPQPTIRDILRVG